MPICDYGCGQDAAYQSKNGKWCCSKNWQQCPVKRKIKSKSLMGKVGSNKGKKFSKETRLKMSNSHKNKPTWNKNKRILDTTRIKIRYPFFYKIEKPRDTKDGDIEVKCKKCSNWFIPTQNQLAERIRQLENPRDNSEQHFYCSTECKKSCDIFGKRSDQTEPMIYPYTTSEYNIWRNEVLDRANNICEYCHKPAENAHHSRPQKLEPGLALDPDFGVACCVKCHYEYGHKAGTECSSINIANKRCI